MIKKDNIRRMVLPLAVLVCLSIMPFLATPAKAANPPAFFTISILAPNTNPARNQWATLMVEQLPKIGIGIDLFDHCGWSQISPRTWGHSGPYPVPSYAEGGFDILFIGWSWGLDIDFRGLFDSYSITPDGDNHYQYDSQEMDWAINNYSSSFVLADRIEWAETMQEILYEDVPAATICYQTSLYPHVTDFDTASWDPLLWASSYQDMSNWSIPDQTTFTYACPADFEDFHTYKTESVYDAQWTQQLYGGIAERAMPSRDYVHYAAESYSSTNGVNYTVQLEPGIVFADGTPVTSEDVQYSFQLLINPLFEQPDLSFYKVYIANDTIVIIDDDEFKVDFIQPYVFQESNLGVDILPKHIWKLIEPEDQEAEAHRWAKNDIDDAKLFGIGPYRMDDYDEGNGVITLIANTHWTDWGGHEAQKFDKIIFQFWSNKEGALSALAGGTVDMVDSQFSPQIEEVPAGVSYTIVEDPGSQEMGFNMLHPYLGTGELCPKASTESAKNIRKAISHMIPREVIVAEILNGLGSPGITPFPMGATGFDETLEPFEYSIAIAKGLMEAAGFVYETEETGIGLYVVIGILALAGASQVFFLKRRK
ncbi:MAG: hypothetical protein HZR80_17090 [Candidatus Heimdallarchaeota archaeon]